MVRDEPVKANRRIVLKKIGAAGVATASIPAVVSAEKVDRSSVRAKETLNDPAPSSIRGAVGGFSVESVTEKKVRMENSTLTALETETNIGTLVYGKTDDGRGAAKLVIENLSDRPNLQKRLSEQYGHVPADSTVMLVSESSSVTLLRSPTRREKRKLEATIDESFDRFTAVYRSDIRGFDVVVENSTGKLRKYRVGEGGKNLTSENAELVSTSSCLGTCLSCASAAVSKGVCYASCALVTTLAGGILCALCVVSSSIGLISCGQCVECSRNDGGGGGGGGDGDDGGGGGCNECISADSGTKKDSEE